jgi:anti-anti-sigma factor
MEYEVRNEGAYRYLEILETVDFYNLSDFKKVLIELIESGHSHIAVELRGNVNEMSSGVIGALVVAQKKMNALKGSFVIVNVGESARNVMHVAGLSGFFTIFDDARDLI